MRWVLTEPTTEYALCKLLLNEMTYDQWYDAPVGFHIYLGKTDLTLRCCGRGMELSQLLGMCMTLG